MPSNKENNQPEVDSSLPRLFFFFYSSSLHVSKHSEILNLVSFFLQVGINSWAAVEVNNLWQEITLSQMCNYVFNICKKIFCVK